MLILLARDAFNVSKIQDQLIGVTISIVGDLNDVLSKFYWSWSVIVLLQWVCRKFSLSYNGNSLLLVSQLLDLFGLIYTWIMFNVVSLKNFYITL